MDIMRYSVLVTVICVVLLGSVAAVANGTEGLYGEYFSTVNMKNLRATRIDPQVFFDWGSGSPHPDIAVDSFSICWTGYVTPIEGGTYTFYVTADDGVRFWVNDTMLVNEWKGQAPTEYSVTATLAAGQPHPIRIDYYENAGGAVMKLEWEGPGEARGPIPSARLSPGSGLGDRSLNWYRNPGNGHYYKIIGPPMTWAAGKAKAASLGGYLATINDAAENMFIMGMFRPVSDVGFIGANDIAEEGVWVWDQTGENFWNGAADGTPVPGFYTNWNTGEPNNSNEEHVATIVLGSGVWNDLNVARERYCIVETENAQINYDGPSPSLKTIAIGDRIEFSVSVRWPVGNVHYQWYQDDVLISGATSATYAILHAGYDHAGLYTCQISDDTPASIRTVAAHLTVVESLPAVSGSGLMALCVLLGLTTVVCCLRLRARRHWA